MGGLPRFANGPQMDGAERELPCTAVHRCVFFFSAPPSRLGDLHVCVVAFGNLVNLSVIYIQIYIYIYIKQRTFNLEQHRIKTTDILTHTLTLYYLIFSLIVRPIFTVVLVLLFSHLIESACPHCKTTVCHREPASKSRFDDHIAREVKHVPAQ